MKMLKHTLIQSIAFAVFLLVVLWAGASFAQNVYANYFLSNQGENITITYTMDDPQNMFVESVMERLKAGQVLNIQHRVTVRENRWFGAEVGRLKFIWQISYNHLQDGFYIQEKGKPQTIPMSEEGVKMLLLSVPERPLIAAKTLHKAQEYVLTFSTTMEMAQKEQGRLTRWLSLDERFFKPQLHAEVMYIAR